MITNTIEEYIEEFERGGWHITDIDKCRKFIAHIRSKIQIGMTTNTIDKYITELQERKWTSPEEVDEYFHSTLCTVAKEAYKKGYIDGQIAKNEAKPVNKSDCCNANYMFARTDEGDGYFQCQSCLRPCNETCPYRNGVIHLTK